MLLLSSAAVHAQAPPPSFKVATYNIQSARGEPALPGRPVLFTDNMNCTDAAQPMNAWGVGLVQQHLRAALSDPAVVALGLSEAWVCGSPTNVRQALGWKASSTERNGVAIVARHGFSGPEEWVQLDTSLNLNAADTMWVLRVPVCLDAACSASINLFSSHWFASASHSLTLAQYNAALTASYDRQAVQTVAFLGRAGGTGQHILIGDLNVWEGTARTCNQDPVNNVLDRLRNAGYIDAWPQLHGTAEGFTGMTNRAGCGSPDGYVWKRPDYVWSPAHYRPLSIARFGMVPAGEGAPSDHYGLVAEFPWPSTGTANVPGASVPPPAAIPAGKGEIVLHTGNASAVSGSWKKVDDERAAGGARLWNPDAGVPKLAAASGSPANYFELSFKAEAGRAYRLWIRGKADNDHWTNDSVFVQFDGSLSASGAPAFRIGTTAAAIVSLEEGSARGVSGWGWQDNGYDSLGPLVHFAVTGLQTIRIQQREDGISIDQVLLSPAAFLTSPPGAAKNDTTIYEASPGGTISPDAPPPSVPGEIILYATSATTIVGGWRRESDTAAAGGARVWNPDAGAPKMAAMGAPASYIELPFTAETGRAYRLWIRGRADYDSYTNDSVSVQFSGSVSEAGLPVFRIGTAGATAISVEEGAGRGLSGWGWQDNGYDGPGRLIRFAVTGPQTIRIQQREDGISIDQIVLSSFAYLHAAPGAAKDDATILR